MPIFLLSALFLLRCPIQDITVHLAICHRSFSILLCVPMTLTVFEECWSGILQNVSQIGFVWCFLMIRLRLRVFWEKYTVAEPFSLHYIRQRKMSMWLITGDVNLGPLVSPLVKLVCSSSHKLLFNYSQNLQGEGWSPTS